MLRALVSTASRWLDGWSRSLRPDAFPLPAQRPPLSRPERYKSVQRIVLTDGVCHTLFEEYAAHGASARGEEETGWLLLGTREVHEAVVLATLPAGTQSCASSSHVEFNTLAQAVGSRIVRQSDRRLTILGVVHTHPGTLRHPSDGDFRGDSAWVQHLRGRDGIFGIGTADAKPEPGITIGRQPKPSVQCLGKHRFSWYGLKHGDRQYRPLPIHMTIGPDLARPLHPVWPVLEEYAEQLERLHRQQAGLTFEVAAIADRPALAITVPLAEPGDMIRILLSSKVVYYYLLRGGEAVRAEPPADRVDRAVYLLLAELTARSN
jgi:proteasome lid subunit RPN8/RPN11